MLALLLPPMIVPAGSSRSPLPRSVRLLMLLALLLGALACWEARDFDVYRAEGPALRGELHIAGSLASAGPTRAWIAIFRREHPGVRVLTHFDGAGAAAGAIASGHADVAQMSRSMRPDERAFVMMAGDDPDKIRIGNMRGMPADGEGDDGLFIYVGGSAADRSSAVEFARIALSGEGQAELARAGYAPLTWRSRRAMRDEIIRLSEREGVL